LNKAGGGHEEEKGREEERVQEAEVGEAWEADGHNGVLNRTTAAVRDSKCQAKREGIFKWGILGGNFQTHIHYLKTIYKAAFRDRGIMVTGQGH